jgi:hypothetical protein
MPKKREVTKKVMIRIWPQSSMGYSNSFQCMDDEEAPKYGYGLPLDHILDDAGFKVGDGAVVEVTLKLVKQGKRPAKNPWSGKAYPW